MKQKRASNGVQVQTWQPLHTICINGQGYIGDYGTKYLTIGDTFIIASLLQRGMGVIGIVTKIKAVPSKSRIRKYRIYFKKAEILNLFPSDVKFKQNFTNLDGHEQLLLAA